MLTLAFSFLAGLLTALSPCVLPVLPVVVSSAAYSGRSGPLALAGGLVAGFVAVGMTLAGVAARVPLDESSVRRFSALLLMLAGIVLLSVRLQDYTSVALTPVASRLNGFLKNRGNGIGDQFVIGALLGGVWIPCVGPTLGGALALASRAETMPHAGVVMTVFGLGAAVPLVALAYASKQVMRVRPRLASLAAAGKAVFAVSLLTMGFAVVTGADRQVEAAVLEALPRWWVELLARY